jgi:Zn-dependent peptidase ImmA (M78 family)/transcriptional regulator with XRE-family HTH domain
LPEFNREMLILARESRALTQTKLAGEVSMSQAEISKFENGLRIPTAEQARRLASGLHYPSEFFFLSESVRSFGSGCVYHRKRQSAAELKLRELLALINIRRIQIARLLHAVNPRMPYSFEHLDIDEHQGDAAKVAQALRSIWQLPPGPVQNVIQVIENAGGIIVKCDFGTDKIDALSQWLPGVPPVFLVNQRIPTDRLRWTLIHEVGHIVMHRFPTDHMEKEADEFAAEFLMPARQIKPHLQGMSLAKLASMKPHWRVAMSALLRRASDLGTITPRAKQYLWMQMGMRGFRTHEPVEIPPEEPTLLKELLDFHQSNLGHGPLELAQIMCVIPSELFSEYLRDGPAKKGGMRLLTSM